MLGVWWIRDARGLGLEGYRVQGSWGSECKGCSVQFYICQMLRCEIVLMFSFS